VTSSFPVALGQAAAPAPLRVVLAGFTKGQLDESALLPPLAVLGTAALTARVHRLGPCSRARVH
jgi:hypothetical protein